MIITDKIGLFIIVFYYKVGLTMINTNSGADRLIGLDEPPVCSIVNPLPEEKDEINLVYLPTCRVKAFTIGIHLSFIKSI
jgi:hypothetical protein